LALKLSGHWEIVFFRSTKGRSVAERLWINASKLQSAIKVILR